MMANWLLLLGMTVCSVGAFGSALLYRFLKLKQEDKLGVEASTRSIQGTVQPISGTGTFGQAQVRTYAESAIRTYAESATRMKDFRPEGRQSGVVIRPNWPQTA